MYGVFDEKNKKIMKISLDPTDIEMELALLGSSNENLAKCEFNIKLAV